MRKYILFCFFSFLACKEGIPKRKSLELSIDSAKNNQESTIGKLDSIDIIALREDYDTGAIFLYNKDGTVWKKIEVEDNFSDSSISPFALKPEDRIMVFKVVKKTQDYYAILVNEEKNIIKYIKPNNSYFIYETWQQHILKAFSVEFSPKTNPLRIKQFDNSKPLLFDKEQFYHPVQINGDWLKVKDDNDKVGWVKWRNKKGEIIIQIYYEA